MSLIRIRINVRYKLWQFSTPAHFCFTFLGSLAIILGWSQMEIRHKLRSLQKKAPSTTSTKLQYVIAEHTKTYQYLCFKRAYIDKNMLGHSKLTGISSSLYLPLYCYTYPFGANVIMKIKPFNSRTKGFARNSCVIEVCWTRPLSLEHCVYSLCYFLICDRDLCSMKKRKEYCTRYQ